MKENIIIHTEKVVINPFSKLFRRAKAKC